MILQVDSTRTLFTLSLIHLLILTQLRSARAIYTFDLHVWIGPNQVTELYLLLPNFRIICYTKSILLLSKVSF